MRDVLHLRSAIHRAVFLAPLAMALAACKKDDPASTATVNVPPNSSASVPTLATLATTPGASSSSAASTTATPDPGTPPPSRRRFPTCPNGAFCATKSAIAPFTDKSSAKTLECATTLEQRDRPDALDGMPRMKSANIRFDEGATTITRGDAGPADACCYTWSIPCPGGRPLLEGTAPRVAGTRDGDAWSTRTAADDASLSAAARAEAADAWLADALSEHASIASFARATLELLALGAPPDLVVAHQRAGMDEVRHAELCFALANALAGHARAPGPLPLPVPRETSVARFARDTFMEGCVGETVSALAATRAAEATTGTPQRTWRALAVDETRHAALAWKTLAWALRGEGGATIGRELLAFAERTRLELLGEAERQAADPDALRAAHGRLSPRAIASVHRDAWDEIVMPTLRSILTEPA